ncbi:diguanylate cyclase [Ketobacter sp. MCCC 1A13808]|uniref:diguanylate cyclase n=1 Tax=Ketobacter sp. MCCC 1A13808 TaxID=2602738 RepID=UPI0012EB59B5|nr:diguanylate cyclase [Ketobacter sp. MCCC 1A13808]MVF12716.1 diguanylate cyclase [Ketobacter sp. MCCC 1A13808]
MIHSGTDLEPIQPLHIPGYSIEKLICSRNATRVYRARRLADGESVMLKCLGSEHEAREAIASLKHEYEIGRNLLAATVIRMHALEHYRNLPVVVLEDFGGDSLLNLMATHSFELAELLSIGAQLAQGLGEIHAANIIHKDINPSNVVYNPDTGVLKIIDFGISSSLTREQAAIVNPHIVEASLPYVSPEQTGRMNRSIDYRSDFYSFGVTLYELLTGKLPFTVFEPIEWFHSHIAKQPQPPHIVNPKIPQLVSDIVMKLMAKMAEDRYQSAKGIEADLRRCLNQLQSKGHIEHFDLGSEEIPQHFQVPQKLYGREQEIVRLLSTFDRITQGVNEITLVSGYSGIGKTCLIRELYKPITERRGYFISGKFDQLHRNIPYSAVLTALRDMMRQLLTESEERLLTWKQDILTAVGPNGQLITEILRELEFIIGPQAPVPQLPPVEAEQRFNRLFLNFIKVFARPLHPLVIFLDDLQWADSASLNLLEMLTHPDSGATHLLIIGAYRDNEVSPGHPLLLCIKSITEHGVPIDEIQLQSLSQINLIDLLADTLTSNPTEVAGLAGLVIQKTAGNPFFTEEFLKDLNKQKLIAYSLEKRCWQWDIEKIRTQQMTDNVVELMKDKLRQLQPESLQLMQLAACIGNRFRLRDLAVVSEQKHNIIAEHLRSAMSEGVIAPIGDAYQLLELESSPEAEVTVEFAFAHDRIQQAAYSLLDDTSKQITHLKIGRLLQNNLPAHQHEQQLFDITNHLNLGVSFIKDQDERLQLCRLNLKAGQRAKAASAYQAAYLYFASALDLLPLQSWQSEYGLTLELHNEAAEAAYLSKDYDTMDRLLKTGFSSAAGELDKVKLILVQISALIARGRLADAVQLAKPLMSKFGRKHRYPENPGKLHVVIEVFKNLWALRKPDITAMAKAPAMTDPNHIAAHDIGERVGSAVIFIQPDMFAMMALRSVRIQYQFGHCTNSLGSWAVYGMVLASQLNRVDEGHAFGRLSLELANRFQFRPMQTRCMHVFNAMVRHWKEPVQTTIEPLKQTYRMAMENGDFEYAVLAWEISLYNLLDAGYDLLQLKQELQQCHAAVKSLKQGNNLDYVSALLQVCDNLLGLAKNPAVLTGAQYNIEQKRQQHAQIGDKTLISTDHELSIWLRYLFGDIKGALEQADSTAIEDSLVGGFFKTARVYMVDALIRLANVADADSTQKRKLLRQVKRVHTKLKAWAKSCPENYRHKVLIVEAERLRVTGKQYKANTLFDEAIQCSADNGFIQEQALASELCACMHLAAGRITVARPYLIQARDLYARWGAQAKVQNLHQRFPHLLMELRQNEPASPRLGTQTERLDSIDITALMKALKSIADEKIHSRMLEAIIATSVEFAGAQRGLLILRNAEGLYCIEGESSVESTPRVLQSLPIEQGSLPQALVNYVMRTQTSVVIHDAQTKQNEIPGLDLDDYIHQHQVRSVLCLPIVSGSGDSVELIGLLYLENNLATGTFTQERFDTLEIIVMAAAGRLELSRKAAFDGLTGLFNHEYFQNALNQEIESSRTHHRDMGLLLIDIDHFKQFNDTWGHQVGDQVLREVSQLIKSTCRASDLVARYGGEEMVVILPTTSIPRAEEVAERIRSSVANHRVLHEGQQLTVTISIGVSMLQDDIPGKDELIRRADAALYRSKKHGRNQVTVA